MNYLYLLFIPAVAFARCNDYREKYYNEHPVHITLTDQQKNFGDIVSFVEGLVDRYIDFNETDSTGQEHLSFNLFPLTEYQPIKIKHVEAGYISNDIYKTTYYIAHFNKLETRWIWADSTYNYVRFSCYITTHRTLSCTAAYNEPMSQIIPILVLAMFILFFVYILYISCKIHMRVNQLELKFRIPNLTKKLTERLKSAVKCSRIRSGGEDQVIV